MKFIADSMLGRLAKWLRILGFDTVCFKRVSPGEIRRNISEGRILLTRNNKLLKDFPDGVLIESDHLEDQLNELNRKGLLAGGELFQRCLICNEILVDLPKEEVNGRVPEFVRETESSFSICPVCKRIYWPGTHLSRMKELLKKLKE